MTFKIQKYRENEARVHIPFKTIGKIVTLCRDRIYFGLESAETFDLDCVCSISARNDVIPKSPSVLTVYSYGGRNQFGQSNYPALMRIEGDSLRETFEGLIKLIEGEIK